jgi:hypothetical protein
MRPLNRANIPLVAAFNPSAASNREDAHIASGNNLRHPRPSLSYLVVRPIGQCAPQLSMCHFDNKEKT